MRLMLFCAAGIAGLIAGAAMVAPPADAATKKRVYASRDVAAVGRPRTRIIVRRERSFLDPGTEVLPGSMPYTNYAVPPGYSPMSVIENTSRYQRSPLPGPYDLPGRNNPYPFSWCQGC